MSTTWPAGRIYELHGFKVHLSAPVLVQRSPGYLWFPTVMRLEGQTLLATMNNYSDAHASESTAEFAFSEDDGLTWSPAGANLCVGSSAGALVCVCVCVWCYALSFASTGLC